MDAIVDTTNVAPGTYLLYTSNLNYLSNNQEDFGGMMTEIVVKPVTTAKVGAALEAASHRFDRNVTGGT